MNESSEDKAKKSPLYPSSMGPIQLMESSDESSESEE